MARTAAEDLDGLGTCDQCCHAHCTCPCHEPLTPSADVPACRDEDPAHEATLAVCYPGPPEYPHPEELAMTRKAWMRPPATPGGRPGRVEVTTLADIARRDKARKPVQCRACLADEVITGTGRFLPDGREIRRSSLRNGICRDRAACEERQPPLVPLEEL